MTIRIFEEGLASTIWLGIWAYVESWNQNVFILGFALQKFCNSLFPQRLPLIRCFLGRVLPSSALIGWMPRPGWSSEFFFRKHCETAAQGSMIKKICSYLAWTTDPAALSINPLSIHLTIGLTQPWCRRRHLHLQRSGVVGKTRVGLAMQGGRLVMANDRRYSVVLHADWWSPAHCSFYVSLKLFTKLLDF